MLTFNAAYAFKNSPDDTLAYDTSIDYDLMLTLSHSNELGKAFLFIRALNESVKYASELSPKLHDLLKKMESQLPSFDGHESWQEKLNKDKFKKWWINDGKTWRNELISIIIEYRNIGHDWQFINAQKELLRRYDNANELLLNCLRTPCLFSHEIIQEIENTLLLPIAEIEKRNCEK